MSKSRKRGLQRFSLNRWKANMNRKRQARHGKPQPPMKLVRFDDLMREAYPREVSPLLDALLRVFGK